MLSCIEQKRMLKTKKTLFGPFPHHFVFISVNIANVYWFWKCIHTHIHSSTHENFHRLFVFAIVIGPFLRGWQRIGLIGLSMNALFLLSHASSLLRLPCVNFIRNNSTCRHRFRMILFRCILVRQEMVVNTLGLTLEHVKVFKCYFELWIGEHKCIYA